MPDVFASDSRRDGELVHGVVADLELRGKRVWLDTQGTCGLTADERQISKG